MAVHDDYVTVQKSQFDYFRQHCERCPYFSEQLRDLSDGRAVVIRQGRPSGEPSKKRKTLHDLRPQEVSPSHSSQQPEPPLPSQPLQEPRSQLPSGSSNGSKVKKPKRTHANGPRKRPQQKPRKNEAADWFLRNAPKATEWRKRQTELGLNTVEQYEQAIRAFRDRPNIIVERKTYQGDGHSEHELVELAERFALLTGHSLMNAKLQKAFATFQALILLSYCEVLRKRGVPQDTLDPIIQHIGGRERDRRTLLASALWLNGVIVALFSHGWTIYRATELFFIDALSITYLTRIHNNRDSELILEHLKTDEFVRHDYSDCLRPEYTIPSLIVSLLDAGNMTANKISIDEICAALGYNSGCIPTSVEGVYKVHAASKSTPVTSLDLDFEVLGPSSFQRNDGPLSSASNSHSTIRASDPRCLHTEGSGQQSATFASVAPGGGAITTDCPPSALEHSVNDSNQDPERDLALNSLSHLARDHASLQSPSLSDNQQRPPLPTPLPSQEHTSSLPSSAPGQNSFNEWEEVENMLRSDRIEDTGYLLLLLHALGGSRIPDLMLVRVQLPQPRWNDSGTKCNVTALEAGLDQQLLDILSDTDRFNQTIEPFVESNTTNGSWTFSLKTHFQLGISLFLSDQEKDKWTIKALKWICFVFPRDQLWESQPSYASVVRSLLPPLNHALQAVKTRNTAACIGNEVLEALLAACKVGNLQSRRSVLTMATHMLGDESPPYIWAEMAYQQSNLLRLAADFDHSERVIHDFCCRCGDHSDKCIPRFYQQFQPDRLSKRLNALYGRLHGSHLENLVQCDKYGPAIEEVDDWRTSSPSSLMECRVLPSRVITVAKIYRSQGLFAEARPSLERCLTTLLPQDTNRCQVLCSLADVYCDLRLPDKAHEIIARDVENERKKVTKTKSFRRLLVAVIDAHIQRGLYGDALRIIEELEDTFNALSDLDVSDQLLHVRVLVASARICHYDSLFHQALQKWEVALTFVQTYKSFEGEGFTYAVIHLSISLAHLESGNAEKARQAFQRAEMICSRGMRDFWIPTFAAWGQLIVSRIQSLTGWTV